MDSTKPEETPATEDAAKKPEEEKTHDIDYADPEQDEQVKAAGMADKVVSTGTESEVCIYK